MDPVQVTNGYTVQTAHSRAELTQFVWDGWFPVGGELPPPVIPGGSSSPTTQGFLDLLANTFVAKQDLIISPTRPTTAPDGTVYINNSPPD